jgi:hypothetical protein
VSESGFEKPYWMETQAASAHDDTKARCVLVSLVSYKVPEEGDLGDVRDYKLFVLLALLPLPVEEPKQELGQDGHPPKRSAHRMSDGSQPQTVRMRARDPHSQGNSLSRGSLSGRQRSSALLQAVWSLRVEEAHAENF